VLDFCVGERFCLATDERLEFRRGQGGLLGLIEGIQVGMLEDQARHPATACQDRVDLGELGRVGG
jgi:hypothetical protein